MENLGFGILSLCGMIFIFAGAILHAFPPKKRNNFYGYRTMSSMSTEEKWKFSQKFSALRMVESGVFLLLISTLGYFVDFSEGAESTINVLAILVYILYMIFRTERALKIKFPSNL